MSPIHARSPAPVRNHARNGLMLMALLGVFAATYPATRAADITFVARPNEEKDDLSVPTKPTPAPTTYSFSGSPSPNSWSFYGDQACSVSMSATVRGKTVQPKHFGGYIDVGTGVVDIFETEFSGRLVPTSTAAGQLVTAPWRLYAWDHTIKIVTDPAYISVNAPTGGANALTREGDVSTTLTSRIPETRIGNPSWTASPAEGLSFNPYQGQTTTITNATAATGRWVTVTARAEKTSPFSGTVTSTSRVAVVDVNISSSTVAEKDEESSGVVVPILPATATSGGTPLSLSISPTNGLSGAVKLERSSCNFEVYSNAALSTSVLSGTQTTATYASASSLPSSPVYLKGVTSNTSTDSTDTLTLTFTPSAQTAGSNPSPFKDKITITTGKIEIAMDGDRDGTINFESANDSHYLFWVNDDHDSLHYDAEEGRYLEDDILGSGNGAPDPNCDDDRIGGKGWSGGNSPPSSENNCRRDLEDFTRLHIKISGGIGRLSGITYWMKFENVTSGSLLPSINLFKAINEGTGYFKNGEIADQQIKEIKIITVETSEIQLPTQYIKTGDQVSPFIIEGKTAGKGDLTILVKDKDNNEICKKAVTLELRPVTSFYQVFRVATVGQNSTDVSINYNSDFTGSDDYFLFVHGFNVDETDKAYWPGTVFKRLWWQGYKGHVGFFDWPCVMFNSLNRQCYDESEYNAWRCGAALLNRINSLNSGGHAGKVRLFAHSQGNVVAGEALRLASGQVVQTYIATQAAVPGDCYQSGLREYFSSYSTPNVFLNYPPTNAPYLAGISGKAGARFSYYNTEDYALHSAWIGSWEWNNQYRPDDYYWYEGPRDTYDTSAQPTPSLFYHDESPTPRNMVFTNDTYEIFARAAEARGSALGVQTEMNDFETFDLSSFGYDRIHYSHSRQFRSNIIDENAYWERVKRNCGF
jgi:hypothetical protein